MEEKLKMGKERNTFKIRPYARLLTMLGEQLIKNEKVALTELIKNSYDADASWVQVRFIGFHKTSESEGESLKASSNSTIEIEDDGEGMTLKTIRNSWMNPATPNKLIKKKTDSLRRTKKFKRIIQGEKGIGRFAVYKLGSTSVITSRSNENPSEEVVLTSDMSNYDDDFLTENGKEKEIFLDELNIDYEVIEPKEIVEKEIIIHGRKIERKPYGTLLRISNLKGEWSVKKLKNIVSDISKMESPFGASKKDTKFLVDIQLNGESLSSADKIEDELSEYFGKSPLNIISGRFDQEKELFTFDQNGQKISLAIDRFKQIREFKKRFILEREGKVYRKPVTCGSFGFEFHVFDFTSSAPPKYRLTQEDKSFVKQHRIYLYRDNVRVFPYGDPDDDWLKLEILRGTYKAGEYLSVDQTIGHISISQEENPSLKDKTNREGLLEKEGVLEDFIAIIQTFLGYLRIEFRKYQESIRPKDAVEITKNKKVELNLKSLKSTIQEKKSGEIREELDRIEEQYSKERSYLISRAEQTEDLAAVGLAVEATSHDILMMIGRAKEKLELILDAVLSKKPDQSTLERYLEDLLDQVIFVEDQLEGIQPMFRSTRRKSTSQNISSIIEKVKSYFNTLFEQNNIQFIIFQEGPSLKVKCNEGVLLQAFINLVDNSVHWLKTVDEERKIEVHIDGTNNKVIVSDSGPGISENDLDFVFQPFFSTKGLSGRGLGLYIIDQLFDRFDYSISYISDNSDKKLDGANFLLDFNQ
ncbi:MAG: sensor histidine kinase [Ekhidna sp.]